MADLARLKVRVGADTDGAERGLARLNGIVRRMDGQMLASATKVVHFGGAIAGAGAVAVELATELTPIIGLAGGLLPLLTAGAQGFGVIKIATSGFGDALKALNDGDVKKINKAMKDLSPEAQKAARSIFGLRDEWKEIKNVVQDNVFRGVNAGLQNMDKLLPIIKTGLGETSTVIGRLIEQGANMITSGPWRRDFAEIMTFNTTAIGQMGDVGINLLNVFRNITVSAIPLARWLMTLADNAALAANEFIMAKRESGELEDFFVNAMQTTQQLARIVGNLVRTFTDVPGAQRKMIDRPLLDRIESFTAGLERVVHNAGGIIEFLKKAASGFLALKLAMLGIQFGPWGLAIAAVVAGLVLLYRNSESFRRVVDSLVDKVQIIIERFGGWKGMMEAVSNVFRVDVLPVIQQVLNAALKKVQMFIGWWNENWPAIQETIVHILHGIQMYWNTWGSQILKTVKVIWDLIYGVIAAALKIISGVIKVVTGIINGDWSRVWQGIKEIFRGVWDAMFAIVKAVLRLIVIIIQNTWKIVTGIFKAVWSAIFNYVRDRWNAMVSTIKSAGTAIINTVKSAFNTVFETIKRIGGNILSFLKGLPGQFKNIAKDMFNGMINGFKSIDIGKTLRNIIGSAVDFVKHHILGIKSPSTVFYGMGRQSMLGFLNGIRDHAGNIFDGFISKINPELLGKALASVTNFSKGLLDKLGSAFGNLFTSGSTGGSASLRAWAAQAAAITGVGASWIPALVRRAMFESGGNPKAVNLTDINAARGDPSKGLMQTISGTFNAYKMPGMSNIWNPVHNMVAAIRYIKARYGSIFSIDPPVRGYHRGGELEGSGTETSDDIFLRASRGEFLVNARQARKFRALLHAINDGALDKIQGFARGGVVDDARTLLKHMLAGGGLFEDLSWNGMPRGYDNDALADVFYRQHRGWDFDPKHAARTRKDVITWLRQYIHGFVKAEDGSWVSRAKPKPKPTPDIVKWGTVSQAKWNQLLAAGWRGRAGDMMEALYRPKPSVANRAAPVRAASRSSAGIVISPGAVQIHFTASSGHQLTLADVELVISQAMNEFARQINIGGRS